MQFKVNNDFSISERNGIGVSGDLEKENNRKLYRVLQKKNNTSIAATIWRKIR
jgi:hypothetical protein